MDALRKPIEKVIREIEGCSAPDSLSEPLSRCVNQVTANDMVKNALSGTWIGHQLHPMLTDIPIGAWTMATALDFTLGDSGALASRQLVGIGVLGAIPTAASGASDWSDTFGASQRIGLVHAVSNVAATVLQASSWVVRGRGHRNVGVALSAAGLGIVLGSSYLGGHLTLVRGEGVNHTASEPLVEEWTDVAASSDVETDRPMRVVAGGVPVVLVRQNGSLYALSATCVHAGGPLDEGTLVGNGCIRCPWHGSEFQLADGTVMRGPASVDQPSWEVRIEGERILVRSDHGSKV